MPISFPTVYLAGPIAGCTENEAQDWRVSVAKDLEWHGIRGINPLRCEPLHGERYGVNYTDPRFGTARAIGAKNMFDVRNCDLTLAYFPEAQTTEYGVSLGTVCELAWAHALGKRTLTVSTHPKIVNHPVIDSCSNWMLQTLDEAVETVVGILGDYGRLIKRRADVIGM